MVPLEKSNWLWKGQDYGGVKTQCGKPGMFINRDTWGLKSDEKEN